MSEFEKPARLKYLDELAFGKIDAQKEDLERLAAVEVQNDMALTILSSENSFDIRGYETLIVFCLVVL